MEKTDQVFSKDECQKMGKGQGLYDAVPPYNRLARRRRLTHLLLRLLHSRLQIAITELDGEIAQG